jgi:hypothetical protein
MDNNFQSQSSYILLSDHDGNNTNKNGINTNNIDSTRTTICNLCHEKIIEEHIQHHKIFSCSVRKRFFSEYPRHFTSTTDFQSQIIIEERQKNIDFITKGTNFYVIFEYLELNINDSSRFFGIDIHMSYDENNDRYGALYYCPIEDKKQTHIQTQSKASQLKLSMANITDIFHGIEDKKYWTFLSRKLAEKSDFFLQSNLMNADLNSNSSYYNVDLDKKCLTLKTSKLKLYLIAASIEIRNQWALALHDIFIMNRPIRLSLNDNNNISQEKDGKDQNKNDKSNSNRNRKCVIQ